MPSGSKTSDFEARIYGAKRNGVCDIGKVNDDPFQTVYTLAESMLNVEHSLDVSPPPSIDL